MRGKARIWIAMALLFASGAAVGFFGSGLLLRQRVNAFVGRGPSGMHERIVGRALRDIELSPGQRREIDLILDETGPKLRALGEECRAAMDRTLEEQYERINAVLTDEQRPEFERRLDEMRRRREEMRERRRPHRQGHRGGTPPEGGGL